MVWLLVELGANKDAPTNDGWMALHWAVWRDYEAIVRLLVELGAEKDAKTIDGPGWTALSKAASRGQEAMVRLLVEYLYLCSYGQWRPSVCLYSALCALFPPIIHTSAC
jgi:ankyrin repeat protein